MDPDRSDWHDIFCQEIIVADNYPNNVKTIYVDRPPWREHRSSIRYVRGFLWVEGVIKYR